MMKVACKHVSNISLRSVQDGPAKDDVRNGLQQLLREEARTDAARIQRRIKGVDGDGSQGHDSDVPERGHRRNKGRDRSRKAVASAR